MYRCPRCAGTETEPLEDGTACCVPCRLVFTPKQPPRLIDIPTDEERRRDLS